MGILDACDLSSLIYSSDFQIKQIPATNQHISGNNNLWCSMFVPHSILEIKKENCLYQESLWNQLHWDFLVYSFSEFLLLSALIKPASFYVLKEKKLDNV